MTPIEKLETIMAQLRSKEGCSWDAQQTHASLTPYLLEEAYEVLESIEAGKFDELREELGDLLLQIVFHSRIAEEEGLFNLSDVIATISQKMIRRHPHIFDAEGNFVPSGVERPSWDKIKREEYTQRTSLLDGIPKAMPALARAQKMQRKAAAAGFDWPDAEGPRAKVHEEIAEIEAEIVRDDHEAIADECGDLLFAVVNWVRHLNVNAEDALRRASDKFERRFRYVEEALPGEELERAHIDEMEAVWERAKQSGL